uniref:Uncharacterized protein n=1 Tax=Erpetoichthys calabaricus TaxID=27687 RepID=A0A8C4RDF4_ERPCA
MQTQPGWDLNPWHSGSVASLLTAVPHEILLLWIWCPRVTFCWCTNQNHQTGYDDEFKPSLQSALDEDEGFSDWTQRLEQHRQKRLEDVQQDEDELLMSSRRPWGTQEGEEQHQRMEMSRRISQRAEVDGDNSVKKMQPPVPISKIDDRKDQYTHAVEVSPPHPRKCSKKKILGNRCEWSADLRAAKKRVAQFRCVALSVSAQH